MEAKREETNLINLNFFFGPIILDLSDVYIVKGAVIVLLITFRVLAGEVYAGDEQQDSGGSPARGQYRPGNVISVTRSNCAWDAAS